LLAKITHTADGGCLGRLRRWRTWGACDKPRGGGYQPLIRGFPNGETRPRQTWSVAFDATANPLK